MVERSALEEEGRRSSVVLVEVVPPRRDIEMDVVVVTRPGRADDPAEDIGPLGEGVHEPVQELGVDRIPLPSGVPVLAHRHAEAPSEASMHPLRELRVAREGTELEPLQVQDPTKDP